MSNETIFPLFQIAGSNRAKIVLKATTTPEYFQRDPLIELFRTYGLTPSVIKDFSGHLPPIAKPLIYLTFSNQGEKEIIKREVCLYVHKKEI